MLLARSRWPLSPVSAALTTETEDKSSAVQRPAPPVAGEAKHGGETR
jgi:hypothetical protein